MTAAWGRLRQTTALCWHVASPGGTAPAAKRLWLWYYPSSGRGGDQAGEHPTFLACELSRRAMFHEPPLRKHQELVAVHDGVDPMGDHKEGPLGAPRTP